MARAMYRRSKVAFMLLIAVVVSLLTGVGLVVFGVAYTGGSLCVWFGSVLLVGAFVLLFAAAAIDPHGRDGKPRYWQEYLDHDNPGGK